MHLNGARHVAQRRVLAGARRLRALSAEIEFIICMKVCQTNVGTVCSLTCRARGRRDGSARGTRPDGRSRRAPESKPIECSARTCGTSGRSVAAARRPTGCCRPTARGSARVARCPESKDVKHRFKQFTKAKTKGERRTWIPACEHR